LFRHAEDIRHYIDFMHNQLRELLTRYGAIAGVWFDLISICYYKPDLFPVEKTYRLIRSLQPQCLISFKQGATGDEDFMSQEMAFEPLRSRLEKGGASKEAVERSDRVWQSHLHKWNETCSILQEKGWGYVRDAKHRDADFIISMLEHTAANRCNLLLNTGPLPDGSIHPEDEAVLLEAGRRIRDEGFPAPRPDSRQMENRPTGAGAE
jgi:alpha-L-fucosidase